MISHQHKCIFIHIPRVAGSSLENWIVGSDWWTVEKGTKHLIASQAKELYREYWDEYFTFSFVRNPWDRVVSGLKFPGYFGVDYKRNRSIFRSLCFEQYHARFGTEVVLEHDHRFYNRNDLITGAHLPGQVYGNILDEKLDFIGTFETLEEDCQKIQDILGMDKKMKVHTQKSDRKGYRNYFNKDTREIVRRMYAKDIEKFGYEY